MKKAKLYLAVDKCPHGTTALSVNNNVGGTRLTAGCCGSWTTQKEFPLTPQGLNGIIKQLSEYTPDNEIVRLTQEVGQLEKLKWLEELLDHLREERPAFAEDLDNGHDLISSFAGHFVHWDEITDYLVGSLDDMGYSQSPAELITRLIDQRDEILLANQAQALTIKLLKEKLYGTGGIGDVPDMEEAAPVEKILKPLMPCAQKCDGCGARFRCLDAGPAGSIPERVRFASAVYAANNKRDDMVECPNCMGAGVTGAGVCSICNGEKKVLVEELDRWERLGSGL